MEAGSEATRSRVGEGRGRRSSPPSPSETASASRRAMVCRRGNGLMVYVCLK